MSWKWSESSAETKPSVLDDSNETVVYIRKDIQRITKENLDGTTYELWGYYEQIIPRNEWNYFEQLFSTQDDVIKMQSDIEYLAMMSEVDLEDE